MKKRYVIFNLARVGYSAFLSKTRKIQEMLAAPMFNSITPTPGEVMPLIENLQAVWNQTDAGNLLLRGERDTIRYQIEDMMARQCLAVNALAYGDMNILLNCGFELNKVATSQPLPDCPIIQGLSVTGTSGEILVDLKGCKQAAYYVLEVRDMNGQLIREGTSSRVKAKVDGMMSGEPLQVRAQAYNATGKSLWTVYYPFMLGTVGGAQNVFVMKPVKGNNSSDSSVA
jgi:hypothetical protein